MFWLGTIVKSTGDPETTVDISNSPALEEPHSQDIPHHDTGASAGGQHPADDHHVSNLELENKLLRKEVASLNEEMVSVVQRAKEAEKSKFSGIKYSYRIFQKGSLLGLSTTGRIFITFHNLLHYLLKPKVEMDNTNQKPTLK